MRDPGVSFPEISGPEMSDLLAYIYFVQYMDERGDATRGAELFRAKSCASCHSATQPARTPVRSRDRERRAFAVRLGLGHVEPRSGDDREVSERGIPWPRFADDEMRNLFSFSARGTRRTEAFDANDAPRRAGTRGGSGGRRAGVLDRALECAPAVARPLCRDGPGGHPRDRARQAVRADRGVARTDRSRPATSRRSSRKTRRWSDSRVATREVERPVPGSRPAVHRRAVPVHGVPRDLPADASAARSRHAYDIVLHQTRSTAGASTATTRTIAISSARERRARPVHESYRLCGQCHGTQYRDWRSGIHGKRTATGMAPSATCCASMSQSA